jgi:TolA-binding protein
VEVRISKLQDRILDLETRISALNDKINLTQGVPPTPTGQAAVEVVSTPAAHARLVPQSKATPQSLPKKATVSHSAPPATRKASFASDPAMDRFREAKILFDTRRYSDAIVEFSDFIKNEPDHPLAPSAQYHLAMGYLEQKEYKLAEDEFNRVLLSYPHSSHIPDTLLALHGVSGALKKAPRATYFKEKLLSQFPNSPQAKAFSATRTAPVEKPEPGFESSEEPKLIEKPVTPTAPEAPAHGDSSHS